MSNGTSTPPIGTTGIEQPSKRSAGVSDALSTLAGLTLVLVLALAFYLAWHSPSQIGHIAVLQADALLDESRYREATALLERTLLTYPDPETRLALSYAYLALHDGDRAEIQARLVTESARTDLQPAAWAQLGRVLRFEGRDSEALSAWQQSEQAALPFGGVPRIEVDSRSSLWHTAMLLWSRGDWPGAQTALQALAGTPSDDVYGYQYARSARAKLAQLLPPESPDAQLLLSSLKTHTPQSTNTPVSTPTAGEQADLPMPPNSSAHAPIPDMRIAGLSEGLDDTQISTLAAQVTAAREAVGQAQASGAGAGQIDLLWGSALPAQSEPLLARDYLEQAATALPNSAQAEAQLGLDLLALGNNLDAGPHLARSVQLDPNLPLPHHALARLYRAQGNWSAAEQQFTILQGLEPKNAALRIEEAEFYRLQGMYKESEAALQEAVSLQTAAGGPQPGQPEANLALALFYIDVRGQGCAGGLPAAQNAVAVEPGDPAAFDALGWALVLCGSIPEGTRTLEQAVLSAPYVPRYYYHLGRAYEQAGQAAAARTQFTRILDLDPAGPWARLAAGELAKLPQ